jgi:hypothetical protein
LRLLHGIAVLVRHLHLDGGANVADACAYAGRRRRRYGDFDGLLRHGIRIERTDRLRVRAAN